MPLHLEILKPEDLTTVESAELMHGVVIGCSPDAVASARDSFTDWLGGYMLERRPGRNQHDGHEATLLVLKDSQGEREVGRLVLRNDALRDARLELARLFETDEARDAWVKSQTAGTNEVKRVEVDMVFESDLLEDLQMVTEGTTIAFRVVNMHGPGGGNPVVAFTGEDRELRAMLRNHWSMDDSDLADFLGD